MVTKSPRTPTRRLAELAVVLALIAGAALWLLADGAAERLVVEPGSPPSGSAPAGSGALAEGAGGRAPKPLALDDSVTPLANSGLPQDAPPDGLTRLRGRLVEPDGTPGSFGELELLNITPAREVMSEDAIVITDGGMLVLRGARADETGAFEFAGLPGGEFKLHYRFGRLPRDLFLGQVEVAVEAGETKDLGELTPAPGTPLAIRLQLMFEGRLAEPGELYEPSTRRRAPRLTLSRKGLANDVEFELTENQVRRVHGLGDAVVELSADLRKGFGVPIDPIVRPTREDVDETLSLPRAEELLIEVDHARLVRCGLRLSERSRRSSERVALWIWSEHATRLSKVARTLERGEAELGLTLGVGSYRYLAFTTNQARRDAERLWGSGVFEVLEAAAEPLPIELSQGTASLTGLLAGLQGAKKASRGVRLRPVTRPPLDDWPFLGVANPDGQFVVRGLPPFTEIEAHPGLGGARAWTGAPGSKVSLNLALR